MMCTIYYKSIIKMSIVPQQQLDAPTYTIKLLLLGESSVGKSSLVNRYTNHAFASNGLLTIGIQVKKIMKQMNGYKIRLQLWDTAGQEKYRTLPSQYFRGIQGILLVYDISNLNSFERIEDWLAKIQQNCQVDQLVLTLVGNKVDLEPQRQVQTQNAKFFAEEHRMKFQQTSAKNSTNVEETIEDIMRSIVKKGSMEIRKEKMNLNDQNQENRKKESDCCG